MTASLSTVRAQAEAARAASRVLAYTESAAKNTALEGIAAGLRKRCEEVLAANAQDMRDAEEAGISAAFLDRLLLTEERLAAQAEDVLRIAALDDPVGEIIAQHVMPNGLQIQRVRVPLGVIGAVFESRPNVTIDISALCLKSGNACVLRGGKEALRSNRVLAGICRAALKAATLPDASLQFIDSTDRTFVGELLQMSDLIDLMVPRGGADLIRRVRDEAKMPVVAGGVGICHVYVDAAADASAALDIVDNAKTRRMSICNAMDSLIVHREIAAPFLQRLAARWAGKDIQFRADAAALAILEETGATVVTAGPDDFDTEFLGPVAAVCVVDSADEALTHIAVHGSGHSEAICTADAELGERFLREVDAAAVYVNASTQFTDGGQFGLGAEIGISTQKMHARGPMGLRELTSYKWVVRGDGQVRPS